MRSSTSKLERARAGLRLRRALESYAAALAQRGAPLPHRLRVELNIYRMLDQDP